MGSFWRGRSVFLTGHTGFKGAWLALWLEQLGAKVTAFALPPEHEPNLYNLAAPWSGQSHHSINLRDEKAVFDIIQEAQPEVIFHMAAQALVRPSYKSPVETFATNVMGTVHVLEAVRHCESVRAAVIVTTDKVYQNHECGEAFVEGDRLGGKDPYSSSKACAEHACQSYGDSFFTDKTNIGISTVRAGNVVGGGDWSLDRLIPDIIRAHEYGHKVSLRYPDAVRPWQHVLEPLSGYLALAKMLYETPDKSPRSVNFGPEPQSFLTVAEVVDIMSDALNDSPGWVLAPGEHLVEAKTLMLDSTLAANELGWKPLLSMEETIHWTADWYQGMAAGNDPRRLTTDQISRYQNLLVENGVGHLT